MSQFVLASVDVTEKETATNIIRHAHKLAQSEDMQLAIVTVVLDFSMSLVSGFFSKEAQSDILTRADEQLHAITQNALPDGVEVKHIVGHGNPYEEVLQIADEMDVGIIVVGAHKPGRNDHVLGPNSARIVRHAKTSVYVIRE